MDWNQARERTTEVWRQVRQRLDKEDPDVVVQLIAEFNSVSAICDKARDESDDPLRRCDYCVVFDSAGPCLDIRFKLTESLLENDWAEGRRLVDNILERLEKPTYLPTKLGRLLRTLVTSKLTLKTLAR